MVNTPLDEYQRRLAFLQDAMRAQHLDAILIYSWKRGQVRYISGYQPNYIANVAFVVVSLHDSPVLFIRFPFDLSRARRESWIENIFANGDLKELASQVAECIRSQCFSYGRIGIVTGDSVMDEMPHSIYDKLKKELHNVEFVNTSYLLLDVRSRKSVLEFQMLRNSGKLADESMHEASSLLMPGQSEFELVAIAEAAARRRGARSYLAAISSKDDKGLIGPPFHATFDFGDTVILEFAIEVDGYWTQVARTFHVGSPSIEQARIYSVVFDAYQAGVDAAKPGNFCTDIFTAINKVTKKAGYSDFLKVDLGHGIGLDLPESPSIDKQANSLIEPGMALVIHPSVHVPGRGRAFLGGTILIHDHGPEPIHYIPSHADEGE